MPIISTQIFKVISSTKYLKCQVPMYNIRLGIRLIKRRLNYAIFNLFVLLSQQDLCENLKKNENHYMT